jgi:hypothetical protein
MRAEKDVMERRVFAIEGERQWPGTEWNEGHAMRESARPAWFAPQMMPQP